MNELTTLLYNLVPSVGQNKITCFKRSDLSTDICTYIFETSYHYDGSLTIILYRCIVICNRGFGREYECKWIHY